MRRPHFVILILSALGLPSISPAFADGALAAPATPPGLREVLAQVKPDEMWRVVELFAGQLFHIPAVPHDSWVIGGEPYVSLHFLGAEKYAK